MHNEIKFANTALRATMKPIEEKKISRETYES